ncbi:aminoglycoside phosphotransferase family protein [Streptosporangium canum]|uniref:aminoglycoside phosphotransferase family protein n=1 Tax=Streptosporangium canum TaxID=324952 RepID=UPI00368C9151
MEVAAAVAAGNTSRVFHVRRADGSPAFLKLTPEPEIGVAEAAALRAWADNPHVVSLIDSDRESGALLLEAVEPGSRVDRLPTPRREACPRSPGSAACQVDDQGGHRHTEEEGPGGEVVVVGP